MTSSIHYAIHNQFVGTLEFLEDEAKFPPFPVKSQPQFHGAIQQHLNHAGLLELGKKTFHVTMNSIYANDLVTGLHPGIRVPFVP